MKLTDLVEYLVNPEQLNTMYKEQGLNANSEALLIYMKDALSIEATITIFEIEATNDEFIFERDGVKYIQLFPVNYGVDLIMSDLNLMNKGYSNLEIAKRLLRYRQNNA